MSSPSYKTSRKYKCPYCDFKAARGDLINHVETKHQSIIPEEYTAARVVYESINKKDYGTCMICGKKVYEWNEKINRYYNLCTDPKCKEAVRQTALNRHIKVYNKPTLLNDPEQQEKMLAKRKISGSYTFTDGGKITYTGKYEKNVLEFMDKVLEIPSTDIQAPGPVLEYNYKDVKHMWITDIYYIPANLLIEVKDGGTNPNNRPMQSYREKQIAKESMITELGKFNYLRLTNNDFSQLLSILAEIKEEVLENDQPVKKVHINEATINEEVGGIPPHRPPEAYIVPYGMNNVFSGYAYSDSELSSLFIIEDDELSPMQEAVFFSLFNTGPKLYYTNYDIVDKIAKIHESIDRNDKVKKNFFIETLLGKEVLDSKEIFTEAGNSFKYYDEEREKAILSFIENSVQTESKFGKNESGALQVYDHVYIHHSCHGYYAATYEPPHMSTNYFIDKQELLESGFIELMNSMYRR